MENIKTFEVTEDHIKLLGKSWVSWDCYSLGAPGIDAKRPYGNKDVLGDIAEILGWQTLDERELEIKAKKVHNELEIVLEILLSHVATGIKPGPYKQRTAFGRDWVRNES